MSQIDDERMLTAYHEAGHIAISYYFGFSVKGSKLLFKDDDPDFFTLMNSKDKWIGVTPIKYGNYMPYAKALNNIDEQAVNEYSNQEPFGLFVQKFALVMAAGWYGEILYWTECKSKRPSDVPQEMDDGPDRDVLNFIYTLDSKFKTYINTYCPIMLDLHKEQIKAIASALYEKKELNSSEIEAIISANPMTPPTEELRNL
ncbi:MAG: hypothetical protein MJY82_01430 [Fibrobacter sp.]|nr:hypothetical protein [Fibrobacter sp.]